MLGVNRVTFSLRVATSTVLWSCGTWMQFISDLSCWTCTLMWWFFPSWGAARCQSNTKECPHNPRGLGEALRDPSSAGIHCKNEWEGGWLCANREQGGLTRWGWAGLFVNSFKNVKLVVMVVKVLLAKFPTVTSITSDCQSFNVNWTDCLWFWRESCD